MPYNTKEKEIQARLLRAQRNEPCIRGHIGGRLKNGSCRECVRIYNAKDTTKNRNRATSKKPERKAKQLAYQRRYDGLPLPTRPCPYNCECCGRKTNEKRALVLDHCHFTGVFRGWLCDQCNQGIGLLGDTIDGAKRAVCYLERV